MRGSLHTTEFTKCPITIQTPRTSLQAEIPEKRWDSPPACVMAQQIQSLAC